VVSIDGRHLMDGGRANKTPISTAVDLGASRVVVLPTGMSCALEGPPRGVVALALHALNLLVMRRLLNDIERFANRAELIVLPPMSARSQCVRFLEYRRIDSSGRGG